VIQKQSQISYASALFASKNKTLKNNNNTMESIQVQGVSHDYNQVMDVDIETGVF